MPTMPRQEPKPEDGAKKSEDKMRADKQRKEESLDAALKDTFPASDPPAAIAPGHRQA